MPDETPDREDTAARAAEKREAQEKDTEPTSSDRAKVDDTADDAVRGGTAGHIPARSD